jgi:hypothetical protein
MKLLCFSLLVSAAAAALPEISSDSVFGRNLLAKARRVNENQNQEAAAAEWLTGYSVKFQGCHNIKAWNDNAEGEDDVKIAITSLVLFRLCPAASCSSNKAAGCTSGYGDYVIETSTFINTYYEAAQQVQEYKCDQYLQTSCPNCVEQEGQDNENQEYCEYDCFNAAKMTECIDRNPYDADNQNAEGGGEQQRFEVGKYMECAQLEIQNNNRRLNEDNGEVKYYVGPYCANQGGAVYLGLFTDDTCSTPAGESGVTFDSLMGYPLPYSTTSIVDSACLTCIEPANQGEQNENDAADTDNVSEQCEQLYSTAGKCETKLADGVTGTTPNESACNYMEGIKIVRQDGLIISAKSRPSAVATSFIVISAMAFCAMAFYVWYLRTRLGVKQNTLL